MTEFNSAAVLQSLEEGYLQNKLNEALTRHWAQYVPSVFTAKLDADPGREERKSEKFLFRPLETFMCHGDPTEVFRQLKQQDQPPELCGKVFKVGEPTYSCRDCGMDPTCVLCIDCFERSAHKSHRYKMSTSAGGGYCDCGDVEAWKTEPFCDIHKRRTEPQDGQVKNPVDSLPQDIRDRATQIFYSTVKYSAKMLLWDKCESPPEELLPQGELKNIHVTMLYNDETHTYEQVISSLEKAIQCSHKEAVDHATTVDREGRSPIYYSKWDECEKIRTNIERQTTRGGNKPLKVLVMHSTVVSHQNFAQKLLGWLQQIITKSDGLRQLFCTLSLQVCPGDTQSIVEKVMLMDTRLWKACRIQSHQLFMSGILMDPESKKQFAVLFTKIYPCLMEAFIQDDHDHSVCAVSEAVQIFTVPTLNYDKVMNDFIQDDHYRSVSVTSATVQLFTVPTLARKLITDHDLLHVVLQVFLEACKSKLNERGKLAFERQNHIQSQAFRRTQYMLYDLKYALTCRPQPEDWTPSLRTNFLHGIQDLLELLKYMQGMDNVKRQVTQHIEFEPEWEGAFNLQLKLQDIICMVLDWAGSDLEVLKETFRLTLNAVRDCWNNEDRTVEVHMFDHVAQCIKYIVSVQPVSIHLPVTRLLAGLFPKLNLMGIPLQQICSESELSPVALMETALRSEVLVSQTSAGMWRRNGYSLLNQIYFYHNVRCRSEMYDRDVLMLQVGAALIEPNEFLIHLVHKFGLMKWIDPPGATMEESKEKDKDGDSHRQIILLADEFLHTLVIILSERYSNGVGDVQPDDSIKREIIHQLCMQPMAHSELVKALPDDPYREVSIDDVVQEVAVFRKPQGVTGKGLYEVKPECYNRYSPFFYHYTKSEQAKSEEAVRKKKHKDEDEASSSSQLQVVPPPVPADFTPGFKPIINILQSDVFIRIVHMVLVRSQAKYVRWFTDSHLDKIFHLIGLALHEERKAHQRAEHSFNFIQKAMTIFNGESVHSLLDKLVGHNNITHSGQIDLLGWLRFQFAEVRQMRDSSYKMDFSEFPLLTADELEAKRKKATKQKAARCRNKLMHRMASMQKKFIKGNMAMWEETKTELDPAGVDNTVGPTMAEVLEETDHPIVIGPNRTPAYLGSTVKQMCILCQETDDIVHTGKAMVLAGYVQMSTVLSKRRGCVPDDPESVDPLFMPSSVDVGAYTSSCGHVMHSDCWQRFYDNVVTKERRRLSRFRQHLSYDIEKSEFLCPLCECLGNTVIPIIPSLPTLLQEREKTELSLNDWLDGIQKTVSNSVQQDTTDSTNEELWLLVPCPLSTITKMMAESVAKNFQLLFDYVYDDASAHFSDSVTNMLRKFSGDCYSTGLGVHPDESNSRVPVMSWSTSAFTVMALEQCLRDGGKPLFGALTSRQEDCLSALVRFSAVGGQVIQQDLIRKQCVRLLSALLRGSLTDKRLQPTPPVCDIELFHYLVSLCLSLPTLYAEEDLTSSKLTRLPTGGLNDHHALQLVFTAHVVQVILAADLPHQEPMETESDVNDDRLLELYVRLRQSAGMDVSSLPSSHQVHLYLREACLPFLRRCALFFNQLTEVRPAEALYNAGLHNEFGILCEYLDLPSNIVPLFENSQILGDLINSWCQNRPNQTQNTVSYPPQVNQLVPLPDNYSELINKISTFTCPKNEGDDSRAPTMCLVCGSILCSQSYCCQTELNGTVVGAATAHAQSCGAGSGVFLRVRESQVVLLCGRNKGCFFAPPYLDEYGETDQGLRRGNPLKLCPDRYKKIQKLWLNHCIPEEIAHVLESNSNLLSIDWHNL